MHMIKKNIFKKIICFIVLSIILIIILGFCYLFRPFSVFRPEYNSAVDITTYSQKDAPAEIRKILDKQTYPGLYIEWLTPNVYLLHDNQMIGYYNIRLSARLRNAVLNIKIKKRSAGSELDISSEVIAILSVPNDKDVYDVKITKNLHGR